MTVRTNPLDPLDRARNATRERLLNCVVRELGLAPDGPGPCRLDLPAEGALVADLVRWSPSGHHRWGVEIGLDTGTAVRAVPHDEFVRRLLVLLDARTPASGDDRDRVDLLERQIADSVCRTARYLSAPPRVEPSDPAGRTRHAEQSLRFGHPFHPVPKSVDGVRGEDADRLAPELGASFRLHHIAVHPELAVEQRVAPGPWIPDEVAALAPAGWPVVPVHPWQMAHLRRDARLLALLTDGRLRHLGPSRRPVYPTSSVRTVCDPAHPIAWKLPLHLRITNFVRTVPVEHARRAADASRVVCDLRGGWDAPGFDVLVESGWRGVDPAVGGGGAAAPRVLAGLLEPGQSGEEPALLAEVRSSGVGAADWLRAFLRISLVPMLRIFGDDGVGFEAHLQNSLLHSEDGMPSRFWVRDMEGAFVSRDRRPAGLDAASPLVYDEAEAWQRLRYHAVVNQLASVVAALADLAASEAALWRVVSDVLDETAASTGPAARWADALRTARTLPAKANLLSRFALRGEDPLYVEVPNPIREAAA